MEKGEQLCSRRFALLPLQLESDEPQPRDALEPEPREEDQEVGAERGRAEMHRVEEEALNHDHVLLLDGLGLSKCLIVNREGIPELAVAADRAARVAHVEEFVEGAQAALLPRTEVDPFAEAVACQVKKTPNREHAAPGRSMVRGSSGEGGGGGQPREAQELHRREARQQAARQRAIASYPAALSVGISFMASARSSSTRHGCELRKKSNRSPGR